MDPFVVIGGDAAGLSAASKLKREAPDREVEELTDLLSLSPDEVEDRGIDLRREHEVTAVDTDAERVTVQPRDGEAVEQPYGDLLVATGGRAVTPIEGSGLAGVFSLHGLDDAAAVRAALEPDRATPESLGGGDFHDGEFDAGPVGFRPPALEVRVHRTSRCAGPRSRRRRSRGGPSARSGPGG
jgi:NADPH-dependent 2,4-dienoyl-CoA reductase/sulfur reductase-like enzyme